MFSIPGKKITCPTSHPYAYKNKGTVDGSGCCATAPVTISGEQFCDITPSDSNFGDRLDSKCPFFESGFDHLQEYTIPSTILSDPSRDLNYDTSAFSSDPKVYYNQCAVKCATEADCCGFMF
jgi:hypothetical protein